MTSRKEQQAELLIMFGELVSPLEELVRYPDQQTSQTRAKASAKFTHDRPIFLNILTDFTKGESGHDYAVESSLITGRINRFVNQMVDFRDNTEKLAEELKDLREVTISHILAVPCELDTEMLDAHSPFTSYIKLRSIVESARRKLIFIDPWVGQGIVRRYFRLIPKDVELTVITKRRSGKAEFGDFIDISKLYADERGKMNYRLMYHSDLHDRYLQCDDVIYHLGGSFKDAGRKSGFTITKVQSTTSNQSQIDKLISESSEQFGPSNSVHPNA